LNVLMDGASLTESGMEFQMLGDEWQKARWPIVRQARGTVKRSWLLGATCTGYTNSQQNRNVCSVVLKALTVSIARMSAGRWFQALGPATALVLTTKLKQKKIHQKQNWAYIS